MAFDLPRIVWTIPLDNKEMHINLIRIGIWTISLMVASRYAQGQDRILVCTGASELVEVDLATCQATLVGNTPTNFIDIAFTPNGRLWGWRGNVLYEIDPENAITTVVGSMPGFGTAALVAFNNDTLLGEYQGMLWGIRVSDAFAWPIGQIGYYASGDLTWYQGDLYMTASNARLIRMRVDADLTTVTNVELVGLLNGGVGNWYGANTISIGPCEDDKIILGFDQRSVYTIAPEDATVTLNCEDLFPSGARGATSLGEVSEWIRDVLAMPNIFSPNGDGVNDYFAPITFPAGSSWALEVYNRWGQVVFESNGVPRGWDGRSLSGIECSDGVYFYRVELSDICGKSEVTHGHVTLLR